MGGLALFAWLWRTRRDLAPVSGALNKVGACLVLVPLLTFGAAKWQQDAPEAAPLAAYEQALSEEARAQLPDIYYIIPDSYPRADVLLETFDYDNTPFLNALEERGFHIVDESYSNYPKTQMSLASSMNLDYLDPEHLQAEWNDALPDFVAQIWDNKVMDFLDSYGRYGNRQRPFCEAGHLRAYRTAAGLYFHDAVTIARGADDPFGRG